MHFFFAKWDHVISIPCSVISWSKLSCISEFGKKNWSVLSLFFWWYLLRFCHSYLFHFIISLSSSFHLLLLFILLFLALLNLPLYHKYVLSSRAPFFHVRDLSKWLLLFFFHYLSIYLKSGFLNKIFIMFYFISIPASLPRSEFTFSAAIFRNYICFFYLIKLKGERERSEIGLYSFAYNSEHLEKYRDDHFTLHLNDTQSILEFVNSGIVLSVCILPDYLYWLIVIKYDLSFSILIRCL